MNDVPGLPPVSVEPGVSSPASDPIDALETATESRRAFDNALKDSGELHESQAPETRKAIKGSLDRLPGRQGAGLPQGQAAAKELPAASGPGAGGGAEPGGAGRPGAPGPAVGIGSRGTAGAPETAGTAAPPGAGQPTSSSIASPETAGSASQSPDVVQDQASAGLVAPRPAGSTGSTPDGGLPGRTRQPGNSTADAGPASSPRAIHTGSEGRPGRERTAASAPGAAPGGAPEVDAGRSAPGTAASRPGTGDAGRSAPGTAAGRPGTGDAGPSAPGIVAGRPGTGDAGPSAPGIAASRPGTGDAGPSAPGTAASRPGTGGAGPSAPGTATSRPGTGDADRSAPGAAASRPGTGDAGPSVPGTAPGGARAGASDASAPGTIAPTAGGAREAQAPGKDDATTSLVEDGRAQDARPRVGRRGEAQPPSRAPGARQRPDGPQPSRPGPEIAGAGPGGGVSAQGSEKPAAGGSGADDPGYADAQPPELTGLTTAAGVPEPEGNTAPEAVRAPAGRVVELAERVADRILVTVPDSGARGEVRISLKESVLDGSDVRIFREGGELKIVFLAQTEAAGRFLADNRMVFQQALGERLQDERVRIEVEPAERGGAEGQDNEGRSRQRYVPQDDSPGPG